MSKASTVPKSEHCKKIATPRLVHIRTHKKEGPRQKGLNVGFLHEARNFTGFMKRPTGSIRYKDHNLVRLHRARTILGSQALYSSSEIWALREIALHQRLSGPRRGISDVGQGLQWSTALSQITIISRV